MRSILGALVAIGAAAAPLVAQREAAIVESARDALGAMRDSASLQQGGYVVVGFRTPIRDLTPFQGQHWIQLQRFMSGADDIRHPTFLMYLPKGDSLIPVGVAYTRRIATTAPLPDMLGFEKTEWHAHVFCRNVPGEGPALADGPDDCVARGGEPAPNQIAMVHTWTVPNPDGVWAHDNPALPFLATGLTPPHHATKEDRLLGIALGETYGAKLPMAHRIEFEARRAQTADRLDAPRAKLSALAAQMVAAEAAGDQAKLAALRKSTIASWEELAATYRQLARTPEIRARFDVEIKQSTGEIKHKHM